MSTTIRMPFYKGILIEIQFADAYKLEHLCKILMWVQIPQGHDEIIEALRPKFREHGYDEETVDTVINSLFAHKVEVEEENMAKKNAEEDEEGLEERMNESLARAEFVD